MYSNRNYYFNFWNQLYNHECVERGLLTAANKEHRSISVCLSSKVSLDLHFAIQVFLDDWIVGKKATHRFKCPSCLSHKSLYMHYDCPSFGMREEAE